jgi:UDP-2,3-diacylglucosamine pyrophosphatase LpxH
VICGHIHHAADRMIEGVRYINCGDWVESRTAIVEAHDGRLQLLRWEDGAHCRREPVPVPMTAGIAAE